MNNQIFEETVRFIRKIFNTEESIPLHAPVFIANEKKYLCEVIDSTFVSYIGEFVKRFEDEIAKFTGSKYAVATVNGTTALQVSLRVAGVKSGDEVLTQTLTFVATANAISHCNASPVFIDSEKFTMGMCPKKLDLFLKEKTRIRSDGFTYNKNTGKRIPVCVPVHTFGHPAQIEKLKHICDNYNIVIIEDAAESLGSYYKAKHTGTFGKAGILSFNGNKIITCGSGGMVITDDKDFAQMVKHLTTTAKEPHKWDFIHNEIAYNFRLTNVNAAIGVAQMEVLPFFIKKKRELFDQYRVFFNSIGIDIFEEKENYKSNYWFNSIFLNDRKERDGFLQYSNDNGIMTRPIWNLMHKLNIYKNCQTENVENAQWLEDRLVNIPSSVIL